MGSVFRMFIIWEGFDLGKEKRIAEKMFVERDGEVLVFRVRNGKWEKSVCGLSFGFYAFNKTGRLV